MLETAVFAAVLPLMYFVNGSSVIPVMTGITAAAALVLAALVFLLKKNKPRALALLKAAGVLAASAAVIFLLMSYNSRRALAGAKELATACDAYKEKHGKYPANLRELKPDFIARIPRARLTIMWSGYRIKDDRIAYIVDPWIMMAAYYDLAHRRMGFDTLDKAYLAE